MKSLNGHFVVFEAEDVNDPTWDKITQILRDNGVDVYYLDGDWMEFYIKEEK